MKHFEAWMVVENAKILDKAKTLRDFEKAYNKEPLAVKRLMMVSEYSAYAHTKPSVETIKEVVEDLLVGVADSIKLDGNYVYVTIGHLKMNFSYTNRWHIEIADDTQFHFYSEVQTEPLNPSEEKLIIAAKSFLVKASLKRFIDFSEAFIEGQKLSNIEKLKIRTLLFRGRLFHKENIELLCKRLEYRKQLHEKELSEFNFHEANNAERMAAYDKLLEDSGLGNILKRLESEGIEIAYKNILHNGDIEF